MARIPAPDLSVNPESLDSKLALRGSQLARALGMSAMSLWRLRRDPDFPRPKRTPTGGQLFIMADVKSYFEALPDAE